jgi:ribosomal protein L23
MAAKEKTVKAKTPKAAPAAKKPKAAIVAKKPVVAKHMQAEHRTKAKESVRALPEASASQQISDLTNILFYPLLTEKAVSMIERENKLAFVVSDRANKISVKKAVQDVYGVKVRDVNLIRDRKGRKKAFVRLDASSKASDVAIKLGVI